MDRTFSRTARTAALAYPLAREALFHLDPETAHHVTMAGLGVSRFLGLRGDAPPPGTPVRCMGLEFPNAVGLAAGLDKDAVAVDALGALGFGFIEVGTLTPLAQPGNAKPRLFRLVTAEGIVNRMGFNNGGVDAAVARLRKRRYRGILGVNIGRNKITPNERAVDDYLACLRAAAPVADYIAVNFSSPNTPGLRELQAADALRGVIEPLMEERDALARKKGAPLPVAIKIAPDLGEGELTAMAGVFAETKVDAVIATNTTLARDTVEGLPHAKETGGLSGLPLRDASTEVIRRLRGVLNPSIPIIGVGGIHSAADAAEKIEAGATLIQLYTGFIYHGPQLVADCVERLGAMG